MPTGREPFAYQLFVLERKRAGFDNQKARPRRGNQALLSEERVSESGSAAAAK